MLTKCNSIVDCLDKNGIYQFIKLQNLTQNLDNFSCLLWTVIKIKCNLFSIEVLYCDVHEMNNMNEQHGAGISLTELRGIPGEKTVIKMRVSLALHCI